MSPQKTVQMLFGRSRAELLVPPNAVVLEPMHPTALPQPELAIRQALCEPIGTEPLDHLLSQRRPRNVAITISDITRPVPNKLFLPILLEILNNHGVADDQITIVIGTGMHRSSTDDERLELVGPDVLRRCAVVDHRADAADTLVRVSHDPPVSVNKIFATADFRIVTGLIEPHFMAGYSGGRKGVCPGLVDLDTVQRFHGHPVLNDPRAASGVLDGNPCHAESLRIARLVGVDFLLNVAINGERQLCGIYAGDLEAAHHAGVADVRRWTSAIVEKPFDLVLTNGGGYPLDQTFYQTTKGMVMALPACHANTRLLVLSDCSEGIGSQTYTDLMLQWSHSWRGFLDAIANAPTVRKDQWAGQMHCRVLERIGQERLCLATDGIDADTLRRCWATPIEGEGSAPQRLQAELDKMLAERPDMSVAVIPNGPYAMLVKSGEAV